MIRDSILKGDSDPVLRWSLLLGGTAALAAGLYGRFKGIGTWPFGVDEFYIARSVDNIIEVGLPRFSCGGYYTRGLLYQYLVAGMRMGGLTPEYAGRLLTALSSLAVVPAAYLLARRLSGPLAGWLTAIILCISVWEIEMARFARMYAPFQAVFAWYLVFYVRYVVDWDEVALRWMVALSITGVLLWEGGVFLGGANILAMLLAGLAPGRSRTLTWSRLTLLLLLLGLLYLTTRDLRGFADLPGLGPEPPSFVANLKLALHWLAEPRRHLLWVAAFLVPLGLSFAALTWLWSQRRRWMAATSLAGVLLCAALHLFALSIGGLVVLLLAGLIGRRDFAARGARRYAAACVGFLLFWAAFYHWSGIAASPSFGAPASLPTRLFGFPDLYDGIIRPWGRTVPVLTIGLALAVGFWCAKTLRRQRPPPDAVVALLILLIAVALAVGATATERIETRYTFFLYPLLLALGVGALVDVLRRTRLPMLAVAWAPLACFAVTEDFQPHHLIRVDSAPVNFRAGMSPALAAHYYPRDDIRAVGEWLASHRQRDALVVADIPSLAQYYPHFDYFFLEDHDPRYEAYVCKNGTTERWTNHPVLYGMRSLEPLVASGRPIYASLYADDETRLRAAAAAEGWAVTSVWRSAQGNTDVLLIAPKGPAQRSP